MGNSTHKQLSKKTSDVCGKGWQRRAQPGVTHSQQGCLLSKVLSLDLDTSSVALGRAAYGQLFGG